jgi:peptide/nickel transport system permease protein
MAAIDTRITAPPQRNPLAGVMQGFEAFFGALRRNRAGLIGFLGLLFYFVLTFIGPRFVTFDDVVKLDEIAGPPGSRLQLVTRDADASQFTTMDSLSGHTVGVVGDTGAPDFVEPYEGLINVETYRWNSARTGPGIVAALTALAEGETDAVVMFSKTVESAITEQTDPELKEKFSHLVVSNPTLGTPHLLGTDTQGRDIASHIVHGGADLITTALFAGAISTFIAVVLGSLAALLGGVVDQVLTAITNFILAIPKFPLLVVLAALIHLDNMFLLALLIGVLAWPSLMRSIRAQVLSLRERDYVEAAVALDLGTRHIMLREILPNMISYVAIHLVFAITFAMYEQIGLVILGLAPINNYTWGVMIYFGRSRGTMFNPDGASMILAPVVAIALFQVFMIMFARALEETFDPRLRAKA